MKHPTEDHSLFSINIIDELVEEYMQLGTSSAGISNFVEIPNVMDCFNLVKDISDSVNMPNMCDGDLECPNCARNQIADTKRPGVTLVATIVEVESNSSNRFQKLIQAESDSKDPKGAESNSNISKEAKTDSNIQEEVETNSNILEESKTDSNIQEEVDTAFNNQEEAETYSRSQPEDESNSEVESDSGQPIPHSDRVGESIPRSINKFVPPYSPPTELKPLSDHLKYAYLDDHQHFPVIIANNLHQEQEELLNVLRKHKRQLGGCYQTFLESTPPFIFIKSYWRKKLNQ
ncbi:hypothetical protein CR513_47450, partial [Mucuna pruriens]